MRKSTVEKIVILLVFVVMLLEVAVTRLYGKMGLLSLFAVCFVLIVNEQLLKRVKPEGIGEHIVSMGSWEERNDIFASLDKENVYIPLMLLTGYIIVVLGIVRSFYIVALVLYGGVREQARRKGVSVYTGGITVGFKQYGWESVEITDRGEIKLRERKKQRIIKVGVENTRRIRQAKDSWERSRRGTGSVGKLDIHWE